MQLMSDKWALEAAGICTNTISDDGAAVRGELLNINKSHKHRFHTVEHRVDVTGRWFDFALRANCSNGAHNFSNDLSDI